MPHAPDQALESNPAARRANQEALRAGRPDVQAASASSFTAVGLRQPHDMKRRGLSPYIFRLTGTGQLDILLFGPGWRGLDAIRSTTSTRVHRCARRHDGDVAADERH